MTAREVVVNSDTLNWWCELRFVSTTCTLDLRSTCELIRWFWVFNTNLNCQEWSTFIFKVSNEYVWWVINIPAVLATGWLNVVSARTGLLFCIRAQNWAVYLVKATSLWCILNGISCIYHHWTRSLTLSCVIFSAVSHWFLHIQVNYKCIWY